MTNVRALVRCFANKDFVERIFSEGFTEAAFAASRQYVDRKRIVALAAFYKYEQDGAPYERVATWQVVNIRTDDPQNPVKEIPACEEWYSVDAFEELARRHRFSLVDRAPLSEVLAGWPQSSD